MLLPKNLEDEMLGLTTKDKEDDEDKEIEMGEHRAERDEAEGGDLDKMPVVKVIELVGTSAESFDDAIRKAVSTAAQSLRHITGADIKHMTVAVKDGKVHKYKVDLKIAFALESEEDDD
jgi:flavin-binding protein dodecin